MSRVSRGHAANVFCRRLDLNSGGEIYATSEAGFIEVERYVYSRTKKDYENKKTKVKIGRHIKSVFPELSDVIVEEITKLYEYTQGVSEFELATTEEDILEVYKNGPKSCMVNYRETPRWPEPPLVEKTPVNGLRAYATPGIAVAYLGTKEKPTARCVVNTHDKKYTRVYGNSTLESALKNAGYELDFHSLVGRKLKKISRRREFNCELFELPYLDCSQYLKMEDDGFLVLPKHRSEERTNCSGEAYTGLCSVYFRGELHDLGMRFAETAQSVFCENRKIERCKRIFGDSVMRRFSTIIDGAMMELKRGDAQRAFRLISNMGMRVFSIEETLQSLANIREEEKQKFENVFYPMLKILQNRGLMLHECSVEKRINEELKKHNEKQDKVR